MRNTQVKYDRDANTTVCDCCGGEVYDDNISKYQPEKEEEGLPTTLRICETCFEEIPEDLCDGEWSHIKADKWAALVEHCQRERVLNFIPATEQINSEEDVREFFAALTKYLVWHPETDFADYVREGDKKEPGGTERARLFSDEEAKELNKCMERSFEVCEKITKHEVDPYEIGFQELAKHNEAMAGAMGRNHKTGLLIEAEHQPKGTLGAAIADNRLTEACDIIRALLPFAQPKNLTGDELMVFTSTIGRASALLAITEREAQ